MLTVLDSTAPVARREHQCLCCTGVIRVGERYRRDRIAFDGTVYAWKTCEPCEAVTGEVWRWVYSPDEGLTAEDYVEWAGEHQQDPKWGEAARSLLRRALTPDPRSTAALAPDGAIVSAAGQGVQ